MTPRNTFSKAERVVKKDEINALLSQPDGFFSSYPLSLNWKFFSEPGNTYPARILVVASRKRQKKAHDRNRIKRLIREAYRKNKHELLYQLGQEGKHCAFAVFYKGSTPEDETMIEKKLVSLLARFTKQLQIHV